MRIINYLHNSLRNNEVVNSFLLLKFMEISNFQYTKKIIINRAICKESHIGNTNEPVSQRRTNHKLSMRNKQVTSNIESEQISKQVRK